MSKFLKLLTELIETAGFLIIKKDNDKHYLVHIPKMREASKKLLDKLNKSGLFNSNSDNISILGAENIQYIRERYRDTNSLLAEELNLPLQDYNYPSPSDFSKDIENKKEVLTT